MKSNNVPKKPASARPNPVSISAGHQPGFTLMEILIVIVIIAVIAAVLIPLVGRMKVSSQAATAILRIRQCGMIVMQKTVDNNNKIVIHVKGTSSNMHDLRLHGMVAEVTGEEEAGKYVYSPAYEKLATGTWPVWGANTDDDLENNIQWERVWFERGGEQRYAQGLNLARCGSVSGYPLLADSSNAEGVPRAHFANDDLYKFAMRHGGRGPVFVLDGSARLVSRGDMHQLGIRRAYLFKQNPVSNPTLVAGKRS